jgi:predicted DNA-binding transcriptional regulator AlpA
MQNGQQEFYDVDELAELLRKLDANGKPKRKAIYCMRQRGEGPPATRIGGRRGQLLFRKVDVDAWLASRAEPGAKST